MNQLNGFLCCRLIDAGVPLVRLDRIPAGVRVDAVLLDSVRGGEECAPYLIRAGYRTIAVITGAVELQNARERLRGSS
jgi:LacI family transcriptional regulator